MGVTFDTITGGGIHCCSRRSLEGKGVQPPPECQSIRAQGKHSERRPIRNQARLGFCLNYGTRCTARCYHLVRHRFVGVSSDRH